jgi:hypothetical protein
MHPRLKQLPAIWIRRAESSPSGAVGAGWQSTTASGVVPVGWSIRLEHAGHGAARRAVFTRVHAEEWRNSLAGYEEGFRGDAEAAAAAFGAGNPSPCTM